MDKFTTHTGTALPLRRSNVDTDQIIPAVYLKRVTKTGFEDGLFAAWRNDPELRAQPARSTPARRSWSPGRTSAPDRRVSTPSGPCRTTVSRSSSAPGSATSSAATPARPACWSRSSTRRSSRSCGTSSRQHPASPLTVDLAEQQITADGFQTDFEIDRLHPLAADGGSGRHRPHPASRRPDRRVRVATGRAYKPKTLPAKVDLGGLIRRPRSTAFLCDTTKMCGVDRLSARAIFPSVGPAGVSCAAQDSQQAWNTPHRTGREAVNKAELIEALSAHYDGSKTEAAKALNAVVQTITYKTAAGEKVSITGFGVFEKVHRSARMVRNPRTGERKRAKATAVPRFRAGHGPEGVRVRGEEGAAGAPPRRPPRQGGGVKAPATKTATARRRRRPPPRPRPKKATGQEGAGHGSGQEGATAKTTAAKKTRRRSAPPRRPPSQEGLAARLSRAIDGRCA